MGTDAVKAGLVASYNRPGGNITGLTFMASELGAKRLGLLLELRPQTKSIGLLVNPQSGRRGNLDQGRPLGRFSERLGRQRCRRGQPS